jgi:hypothetical protein
MGVVGGLLLSVGSGVATGATAPVYLNDLAASSPVEPVTIGGGPGEGGLPTGEESFNPRFLTALVWSSWGSPQATATGMVSQLVPNSTATSAASVTVSGLQSCDGVEIYTNYKVRFAPVAVEPRSWARAQSAQLPCTVSADGFVATEAGVQRTYRRGECSTAGIDGPGDLLWSPRLPKGALYAFLCRMHWTGWGSTTARGVGVFRDGLTQWPVVARFSTPAFCTQGPNAAEGGVHLSLGVNYSTLTMTLYGPGEPEPTKPPFGVRGAEVQHLLHAVGHERGRMYRQAAPAAEHCL